MVTHEQFLLNKCYWQCSYAHVTNDKFSLTSFASTNLKPVAYGKVFIAMFWLGRFYLLVCKEELVKFPSSRSTRTDEQFLQCVKFLLDKCTCSKASLLAFDQVHMSRKNVKLFFTHQQTKFAGGTCQWTLSRVCNWLYVWPCIAYFWWSKIVRFHRTIFVSKLSSAISYCCFLIQLAYIWI